MHFFPTASVFLSMFYNLCMGRTFSRAEVHSGEMTSLFLMYPTLYKKETDKLNLLTHQVSNSLALVKKSETNIALFPFLNTTSGTF